MSAAPIRWPILRRIGLGNLLDLRGSVQIGFVDDQQHRLVQIAKLRQGLDLDPVEVAVGDEQHEVGVAHRLLGELAPQLARRLVDARRVDQDQPGVLKSGLGDFVGRAVLGGNGEDRFARERIKKRALARADLAEGRDFEAAVLELRRELLDIVHLLLDAGALLRAQPGVRRKRAQRFDRIGQYRLILVLHAGFRGYEAAWNCNARPGLGRMTRLSNCVSAAMSGDGRRVSIRRAPRAS